MSGRGMLFSQMRPGVEWAARFHRWYDEEHIPARLAIPGFASACRYEETGDHFLAVYHLDDMGALATPAYRALKEKPSKETAWMLANVTGFTRYTAELLGDTGPIPAPGAFLFTVAFDVPAERTAEFDRWYDEEHVPLLRKAKGWLRVRRYAARPDQAGPKATRFALHELADASVMNAPERQAARNTPWRAELAKEPWFEANHRNTYRLRRAFARV
jgi:hypothetical protein